MSGKQYLYERLCALAGEGQVLPDEPLKNHTTFRIGGNADFMVSPGTEEELIDVLRFCREESLPFYLLGNGSNLLVSDEGYRGVIIRLFKNFGGCSVDGTRITARSGVLLSAIAHTALAHSLAGFAFAGGIPGTLGGGIVMNAGAYGSELKNVVSKVRVLTPSGEIEERPGSEMGFGYRTSIVEREGLIVLGAEIELAEGDQQQIREEMDELRGRRIEKQPLDLPSAGSTFKRPPGHFAGKLIMDAGLSGYRVGDAQVSPKHCGFVVNVGQASAGQVAELIRDVRRKVMEESGILLEPEVKPLGFDLTW